MNKNFLNTTDKIASTHLGKKSSGSESYDSSLLVAIPRIENRKQYNIENSNLPFIGFDIWHAYEFSSLTKNNIPFTKVLKIKYNCDSEFLIESKSLKLYLNSFNMSQFGNTIEEALEICKEIIIKDLSEILKTKVEVKILDTNIKQEILYNNFKELADLIDENQISVEKFKEAPEVLTTENKNETKEYYIKFSALRSNCRVTHQPDFGVAYIYYKSKKHIFESSLIKYLTSFRSEYHFHEECTEMIYKRLEAILDKDDELFVSALYTRRGGIDICPSRWSKNCSFHEVEKLLDLNSYAVSGIMQ